MWVGPAFYEVALQHATTRHKGGVQAGEEMAFDETTQNGSYAYISSGVIGRCEGSLNAGISGAQARARTRQSSVPLGKASFARHNKGAHG